MSSQTPVLLPISTCSLELELEGRPIDKVTSVLWEQKMLSKIVADQAKFFGTNKPQHHQLNFLEDITRHDFVDSKEFISDSGEEEDEDSDYEDIESGSVPFDPQSPPRKRQKQPQKSINKAKIPTSVNLSVSSTTFEAFDKMPILSNNLSQWNQILEANPSFWEMKGRSWKTLLDEAYSLRKDLTLSKESNEELYQNVLGVLREIRKVKRSIYSLPGWQKAIKVKYLP
ncbi:hypothetical protein GALMADRAFT_217615 [Galerina marginata CBS 339.88]|uniref:Uncharacterized protein n=1 Tax=Galerina marginata (strain CBS 339.88) TaxID=685588 RepID=A0A067S3B0_GALM3|nr:hypothetical protein GALMADRAFT_217615 [Galerina marginata CBS 339.88]